MARVWPVCVTELHIFVRKPHGPQIGQLAVLYIIQRLSKSVARFLGPLGTRLIDVSCTRCDIKGVPHNSRVRCVVE